MFHTKGFSMAAVMQGRYAARWAFVPDFRTPEVMSYVVEGSRSNDDGAMYPKYEDGDAVGLSTTEWVAHGDDALIRFRDGSMKLSRLFFETDKKGRPILVLKPHNDMAEHETVNVRDVAAVYRVIAHFRKIDWRDEDRRLSYDLPPAAIVKFGQQRPTPNPKKPSRGKA